MTPVLRLSVVIPTYDRPDSLARGLTALGDQTYRGPLEVIVVDDGSQQPVDQVVARFRDGPAVTLLRQPNGGLAAARNRGAARASGDVLLFLDDDIRPAPRFLAAHMAVHESDDMAVALGSLPHPDDLEMTPFLYYLDRIVHYDLFKRYGSADRIPLPPLNGNSSLRRAHFEAAGGYDLCFASYGGEDTEMGYRLIRRGLRFVYAPDAAGYHYHRKGFDAYKRDMYSSGVTMVTIVRKHPEVLQRVKMDIVRGRFRELPRNKRWQRLVYRALSGSAALRSALELLLGFTAGRGWKRASYPLYLLLGHYHYARGMEETLAG